jgi:hypothetical protein
MAAAMETIDRLQEFFILMGMPCLLTEGAVGGKFNRPTLRRS